MLPYLVVAGLAGRRPGGDRLARRRGRHPLAAGRRTRPGRRRPAVVPGRHDGLRAGPRHVRPPAGRGAARAQLLRRHGGAAEPADRRGRPVQRDDRPRHAVHGPGAPARADDLLQPDRARPATCSASPHRPPGATRPRSGSSGSGPARWAPTSTPGLEVSFFEIDPVVIRVAEDPRLLHLPERRAEQAADRPGRCPTVARG